MTRTARGSLAAVLEKLLDPPILERMKRHYRQPTAGHQQLLSSEEPAIELAELVIDSDTESLEGASCGILARFEFRHGRAHDFGELDRPS